ncbi:hypothetical protein BVRB_9g205440 [Beta vulgaris subsp. vulgaris]|nr:hypothetical protein BVRB_9g205440 [Beta vulgaris subsp. vulgaris]
MGVLGFRGCEARTKRGEREEGGSGDVGAPTVVDDVVRAPDGTGVRTDGVVITPPRPT